MSLVLFTGLLCVSVLLLFEQWGKKALFPIFCLHPFLHKCALCVWLVVLQQRWVSLKCYANSLGNSGNSDFLNHGSPMRPGQKKNHIETLSVNPKPSFWQSITIKTYSTHKIFIPVKSKFGLYYMPFEKKL